jgi:thioredoxin 1
MKILALTAALLLPLTGGVAVADMHAHGDMAKGDHAMHANALKAYSEADTKAAIESGKPVLVHFNKTGCPTCAAQLPTVESFLMKHEGVMAYQVDYTKDEATNKMHGVKMQSTLILFKDGKEIGRSTGETDPAKLNELLAKLS